MNEENKEKAKSNVCLICKSLTHKELKYCIFHAGEKEKTKKEFIDELKKYIRKIKKDKIYSFKDFIFIGDINFKKDINITIFKNANFTGATFKGDANFTGATFKGDADFGGINFGEDTYFTGATFKGDANFGGITIKGVAYFTGAIFKGDADFGGITFGEDAYFTGATFKGDADFREATFKEYVDFSEVTFEKDADFRLKYLVKILNFSKIKAFSGKKLFIRLNNEEGEISFERAYLENTYLDIELVKGILIDFTGALLKNTKIKKDQTKNHILQEKEKEFSKAKEIYLLLKNNFHSIGQYDDESWAFKKEKDMDRLTYSLIKYIENKNEKVCYSSIQLFSNLIESCFRNKKGYILGKNLKNQIYFYSIIIFRRLRNFVRWIFSKNILKYLFSQFLNIICGYGEKPIRVIITSLFIVFICAILYMGVGIYYGSGSENLVTYSLINEYKSIINSNNPIFYLTTINWNKIYSFFYFSAVTFTTLGFGDFHPSEGSCRVYASIEAFIGAFMMALFIYTFARKTGGR